MAALSDDAIVPRRGPEPAKFMVPAIAADTFYGGALVFADATNGDAQVGSLAAGDFFLGICTHQQVIAAAGDLVEIYGAGIFGFPISGTTSATDMGMWACVDASAISDNPADVVTTDDITVAANDILLGQVISVEDNGGTNYAYVQLTGYYPLYDATAPAAFRATGRT